ncbi:DUF523 domain-containing protein [Alkaliphilus peptidifermentans]|uniref:Uncharacterized conserved protein YbbK, DUF523 family n=1 Tax=Alkaliphilus peptidifermentans DSM 18978 TaxID=1120976 RepID=A0A1G5KA22_9FIRM|nr:DUF523 domain-containing protein [Alkaliphilus peptidifermentans]SCY97284.1 Uncharacterized conserved protein YbbK, DUF523 family [Alkaliphilus peptidifermentans DSM 18978]
MKLLISACLLGVNCKYSGGNNIQENISEKLNDYILIPICPEQLGGLTTPRPPAEIQLGDGFDVLEGNSKVINIDGQDVTEAFIKGAEETLKIAEMYNIQTAILKARSPSCGLENIYDGSFSGKLKKGCGVTTALLKKKGIAVFTEDSGYI